MIRIYGPGVAIAMQRGKHRVLLFGERHGPARPTRMPAAAAVFPDALFRAVAAHDRAAHVTFAFEVGPPGGFGEPYDAQLEQRRPSAIARQFQLHTDTPSRRAEAFDVDRAGPIDRLRALASQVASSPAQFPNVRVAFGDWRYGGRTPGLRDIDVYALAGLVGDWEVDRDRLISFLENRALCGDANLNARACRAAMQYASNDAARLRSGEPWRSFAQDSFQRAAFVSDARVIARVLLDDWSDLTIMYFGSLHVAHIAYWLFQSGFQLTWVSRGENARTLGRTAAHEKFEAEGNARKLRHALDEMSFGEGIFAKVEEIHSVLDSVWHDGHGGVGGLPVPLSLLLPRGAAGARPRKLARLALENDLQSEAWAEADRRSRRQDRLRRNRSAGRV